MATLVRIDFPRMVARRPREACLAMSMYILFVASLPRCDPCVVGVRHSHCVDDNRVWTSATLAFKQSSWKLWLLKGKVSKMNNEQCLALIEHYKNRRFLWDSRDKKYHNKNLREDAWREISQLINFSVADAKKKMTILMGSYRRERSRYKQRLTSGSGY